MSDQQKPGDPADRAIDAKADGAFGGAVSHRAGYGGIEFDGRVYSKLEWVERTARTGGTLAAGEGRMLLAEIDRQRAILAALREPSAGVVDAMMNWLVWTDGPYVKNAIRGAVTAAEWGVAGMAEEEITAMADAAYERATLRAVAAAEREHTALRAAIDAAIEAVEQEVGRE